MFYFIMVYVLLQLKNALAVNRPNECTKTPFCKEAYEISIIVLC